MAVAFSRRALLLDEFPVPQLSDELANNIQGSRRMVLPGGHMIHDEKPDHFFGLHWGTLIAVLIGSVLDIRRRRWTRRS